MKLLDQRLFKNLEISNQTIYRCHTFPEAPAKLSSTFLGILHHFLPKCQQNNLFVPFWIQLKPKVLDK